MYKSMYIGHNVQEIVGRYERDAYANSLNCQTLWIRCTEWIVAELKFGPVPAGG